MSSKEEDFYSEFLNRWAARSERLHRVGIHPFGYDPDFECSIEGHHRSIVIPEKLADIICGLVIKIYPETKSDKKMIKAYEKRQKDLAEKIAEKLKKKKERRKKYKREKPDNWYGFKAMCELYDFGQSNMTSPSQQQYCHRKDRQEKERPYWIKHKHYPLLRCDWRVCPKLKGKSNG